MGKRGRKPGYISTMRKVCEHGVTPKSKCVKCTNEYERIRSRKKYSPEKNRAKYLANKEAHIVRCTNLRAKRMGVPGVITLEYWLSIKDGPCDYCGSSKYPLEIDHIIGLSSGGTNYPENVHAVCQFCNRSKHCFGEDIFLEWLNSLKSIAS